MYVVCTCVWDETPSYLHQEGGRARYQQSLIMSAWLDHEQTQKAEISQNSKHAPRSLPPLTPAASALTRRTA